MRAALAVLALASPASALVVDDLRLQWSPRLGTEFTASGELQQRHSGSGGGNLLTSSETASQDATRHDRFALSWRHSFGGLRAGQGAPTIGLEFGTDRVRQRQGVGSGGQATFDGDAWLLDVFAGWSWRVTSRWHVEQGLLLGGGPIRWEQRFPSFYADGSDWVARDRGFAYEYGFAIASAYEITDHLVVGIDLRHLVTRSRVIFAGAKQTGAQTELAIAEFSFRVSGFGGAAFAGYRF